MRFNGLVTRPVSNRRGAALALMALGMPVLIGMIALGVDLGMMFSARAEAQRAADAGALAGAGRFQFAPDPYAVVGQAESDATTFATDNFVREGQIIVSEVTAQANPDSQMVRVTVRREIPTWFAKIFGVNSVEVAAQAVAHAYTAGATSRCVRPFAVPDLWLNDTNQDDNSNDIWEFNPNTTGANPSQHDPGEIWHFDAGANGESYGDNDAANPTGWGSDARDGITDIDGNKYVNDYGRPIPIKLGLPPNSATPSFWYHWVVPGSSNNGVPGMIENIQNCNTDVLEIGDSVEWTVETKNGLSDKPIYEAVYDHIYADDAGAQWIETIDANGNTTGHIANSAYTNPLNSKRVMTIALFHPADQDQGKQHMRFADFALVFLEDMCDGGQCWKNDIMGRFLGFVPGNGNGGPTVNTNIVDIRLISEDRWVPYTP